MSEKEKAEQFFDKFNGAAELFEARGFKRAIELLRSEECLKAEWEAGWVYNLSCKFLADWLESKLNEGKKG